MYYRGKSRFRAPTTNSCLAKSSKGINFEPVLLSGNPIKVYGVIIYNYLANRMNWLELGYSSDSFDSLLEYLPASFDTQRRLLEQSKNQEFDEKQKLLESVVDSISSDLALDTKNLWLFTIGQKIKSLKHQDWGIDGRTKTLKEINELVARAPAGSSPQLKVRLNELINESDNQQYWKRLQDIEDRLFDLGN